MGALGFIGLEFIALSVLFGLPDEQFGARILATVAVFAFGICALKENRKNNF
jgi:hypothetical protein